MKQFEYKKGVAKRIDVDNLPKTVDEQVDDFKKLSPVEKILWMENFGNITWRMKNDVAKRQTLLTKCGNAMFNWKKA